MEVRCAHPVAVNEPSQSGEARRQALRLAQNLGFDEMQAGRVALLATELATNLVKHTSDGGELLLRPLLEDAAVGVELLALDAGPGIANVAQALRDGYSSAGSAGTGLGALARMADFFELYSLPQAGTAVLARVFARAPDPLPGAALEVGVVHLPKPGEEVCGDGCALERRDGLTRILMVDGLGHGPGAHEAAGVATRGFLAAPLPLEAMLQRLHGALRPTRGAALALVEVDPAAGTLRFAGVGNLSGSVVSAATGSRSLISHNGTVGHQALRVQQFSYAWPADALLVLHTDGLSNRWNLERYPGLAGRHPSLIAGVLYRDFGRNRDDVTVLVARNRV